MRLDRLRLAVNITNLAASLLFVLGAIWALCSPAATQAVPWLAWVYRPLVRGFSLYRSLGPGARAATTLGAFLALALLLLALLLSFKVHLEDVAVMLLGIPFYLLLAANVFLIASLVVSAIRAVF